MKTNFSMLFYLKKQRNYKSGLVPVYLRITVDGKRSEVTTGRECDPEKWISNSGRAIGTKENIKSFNAFLDNLQSKVYDAHRYLSENEKLITEETIKNKMLGKSEKSHMLIKILREHNRKVAEFVGNEFAPATHKRYETSLRHTQAFLKYQYKVSDISIGKIDNAFVAPQIFRQCLQNRI